MIADAPEPSSPPHAPPRAPTAAPRILIVEDDTVIGAELVDVVSAYGMQAVHALDLGGTLDRLQAGTFDVVVLDQWLGRVDALPALPIIRATTDAQIIVLTGNKAEADRIVALEVGADDFLLKPISGRELVARIRARLRRRDSTAARPPGDWCVQEEARRILAPDGSVVPLTGTEFDLLAALMETPGHAVERDPLSLRILGRPFRSEDRALDNLVHNIRLKFAAHGVTVVATVRNKGYAFTGFPPAR
jgi:DNA-binding response OmpR family regulator